MAHTPERCQINTLIAFVHKMPHRTVAFAKSSVESFLVMQNDNIGVTITRKPYFIHLQHRAPEQLESNHTIAPLASFCC